MDMKQPFFCHMSRYESDPDLPKSPFDVPGIKTKATTKDILDAVKESRAGTAEPEA